MYATKLSPLPPQYVWLYSQYRKIRCKPDAVVSTRGAKSKKKIQPLSFFFFFNIDLWLRFISQSGLSRRRILVSHLHCWRRSFGKRAISPDVSCRKRLKCQNGTRFMSWPHSPNKKTNQCSKRFCLIIILQLFHMLMRPTFSSKHPAFTIPTTKIWLLMMPSLNELRFSFSPYKSTRWIWRQV